MMYKILGFVVWNGAKLFLRRKYGAPMTPKAALAGGFALVTAGVLLARRRLPGG